MSEAPNSLDAERALIHSVLIYPELYATCGEITAQDFLQPAHQEIWEAFGTPPIDAIAIRERLSRPSREALLDCLQAEGTSMHAEHYVAIVRDRAIRRRTQVVAAELMRRLDDIDAPVDEVVGEARKALAGMGGTAKLTSFRDLSGPVLAAIEQRVENRERGGFITGARTGITKLDEKTGGLQPGWAVVIAAETGGGKTAMAMQTAENVALAGGTALAVNMEMPAAELAERMIVHAGEMNSQLVRVGAVDYPGWQRLQAGARRLYDTRLFFEDKANTMPAITAAGRRWRAKNPDVPGFMVVDFAQMIRGELSKGMNRAQQIGIFAQDLKSLAKELGVPIAIISQLNRASQKQGQRPSKLDLKESGDLENAADLILLIWNKDETSDGTVLVICDKFRSGERFTIPARWVGRHYKFSDATWEEAQRYADDISE